MESNTNPQAAPSTTRRHALPFKTYLPTTRVPGKKGRASSWGWREQGNMEAKERCVGNRHGRTDGRRALRCAGQGISGKIRHL